MVVFALVVVLVGLGTLPLTKERPKATRAKIAFSVSLAALLLMYLLVLFNGDP
jgi:hypothetical protein